MSPGEIHLADVPFGGSSGRKLRPVLILAGPLGTVPEYLVAYVMPAQLLSTDVVLDPNHPNGAATNLKGMSLLRLHKLATVHQRSIVRKLGSISPTTILEVEAKLRAILRL